MKQQMQRIQWPTAIVLVVFVLAITAAYLAGPALGVPDESHKSLMAGLGVLGMFVLSKMRSVLPRGEQ